MLTVNNRIYSSCLICGHSSYLFILFIDDAQNPIAECVCVCVYKLFSLSVTLQKWIGFTYIS